MKKPVKEITKFIIVQGIIWVIILLEYFGAIELPNPYACPPHQACIDNVSILDGFPVILLLSLSVLFTVFFIIKAIIHKIMIKRK
jgi:hypothetical protein